MGVGGGASSLGLAGKAELIIGVDRLPAMLESFKASARSAGVAARSVLGTWPAVADQVEVVDVAVSHHAVYGITELKDFMAALTGHARHRVVLEVSTSFPQARRGSLWKAVHGIDRSDHDPADEVEAVPAATGLTSSAKGRSSLSASATSHWNQ